MTAAGFLLLMLKRLQQPASLVFARGRIAFLRDQKVCSGLGLAIGLGMPGGPMH